MGETWNGFRIVSGVEDDTKEVKEINQMRTTIKTALKTLNKIVEQLETLSDASTEGK